MLANKYPPIENCKLVAAPKVNPEIMMSLSDQHKSRDNRLADIQKWIGAGMTAIGKAISALLKEEGGGDRNLLEWLGDAGRLLAMAHHRESESRRVFGFDRIK